MSTIYIVKKSRYSFSSETEIDENVKACRSVEKAEAFISEQDEKYEKWVIRSRLLDCWKRRENKIEQPKKDTTLEKDRSELRMFAIKHQNISVVDQLKELDLKIEEINTNHKKAMFEYEKLRLAQKEEFTNSLHPSDREIFLNDNIVKTNKEDYSIEELELED